MDGGTQELIAEPAQIDFVDLSGLVADRSRSSQALQTVRIKALAIRADLAQQARGDLGTRSGQRTKEIVIGMLGKELLDLGAVGLNLVLEQAQHPRAGQRQSALGAGEHCAGDELARPREDFHAFGVGLRPDKLMAVQELFPFAFASRDERLRSGEGFDKSPGARQCPVLKGFQCRRIIFVQRALELVDQGGALLNQRDLVAAKQPQLGHERIFVGERSPAVAINAQGVGQTPGVDVVGLVAAGRFAFPVALLLTGDIG